MRADTFHGQIEAPGRRRGALEEQAEESADQGVLTPEAPEDLFRALGELWTAADALDNAQREMEQKVQERTAELSQMVETLAAEVASRIQAEDALRERSEQLQMLAAELTLAEQRERRRIAEVLHGDLQQLLVGAKLILSPLAQADDPTVRRVSREATELILRAIHCSRSLTEELSPPILHAGGLLPALEWLARWMGEKHNLAVVLRAEGTAELESHDMTILLFQAIRELLFNTVKHAHVQTASVEISRRDGHVQVIVSDTGAGFDPTQLRLAGSTSGGFGLFSIRERLELLGGRLEIKSAPGKGSQFTLLAPLRSSITGKKGGVAGRRSWT